MTAPETDIPSCTPVLVLLGTCSCTFTFSFLQGYLARALPRLGGIELTITITITVKITVTIRSISRRPRQRALAYRIPSM
jgi:hypothetical protein